MAEVRSNGAVKRFPAPIRSYDVHIYFWQTDAANTEKARTLREEIQQKFPELKVYKFWDAPIGPHPTGMFEVDMKTPDEFAAFVPWIQVNRRGLSVLVHPNTGRPLNDHTINAIWLGDKQVLNTTMLDNNEDQYGYWDEVPPTPDTPYATPATTPTAASTAK